MEGNMTPKDLEKFERIWKKLEKTFPENMQGEHCSPVTNYLQFRIARLEKLVYFLVMALAGEGWFTDELKETVKRFGIEDLFKREVEWKPNPKIKME